MGRCVLVGVHVAVSCAGDAVREDDVALAVVVDQQRLVADEAAFRPERSCGRLVHANKRVRPPGVWRGAHGVCGKRFVWGGVLVAARDVGPHDVHLGRCVVHCLRPEVGACGPAACAARTAGVYRVRELPGARGKVGTGVDGERIVVACIPGCIGSRSTAHQSALAVTPRRIGVPRSNARPDARAPCECVHVA